MLQNAAAAREGWHPMVRLLILVLMTFAALGAPPATAESWPALAERIAAPWPALQQPDGRFADYVAGGRPMPQTRYAEAMLGYGLLLVGLQDGRRDQVDAGLRAIAWSTSRPYADNGGPSVFENLALAAAYNLARARLSGDAAFEALRRGWEEWLRQVQPLHLHRRGYGNKHLVEAVAHLELVRTHVASGVPGSVLSRPLRAVRRVRTLLERRLPRLRAGRRAFLLSDPPKDPRAYHALSVGMLARACGLMACRARTRAVLAAARRASWLVTAPDGDLAYAGRSQEQGWALAFSAYGAPRVAGRALGRLAKRHPVGREGMWITPAGAAFGLDPYAGAGVYNGLTLVALGWAVERGDRAPTRSRLRSDRNGAAVLGRGVDRLAVVRSGRLWFAVRQRPAGGANEDDLRMDFGLVALKHRAAHGWRDVAGPPPYTAGRPDSAGPVLVRAGARPVGRRLHVRRRAVMVAADLITPRGRVVRRGVPFRFAARRARLTMTMGVRRGDVVELSTFASPPLRTAATGVVHPGGAVTASGRVHTTVEPGYHSAVAANLARVRITVRAARTGALRFAYRAAPGRSSHRRPDTVR
jgi:hypothetical protein